MGGKWRVFKRLTFDSHLAILHLKLNGTVSERGAFWCFGAVSLKRGEESSKFPVAIFVHLFSYTIFKQFFNISTAQNKNYFKKAHF